MKSLLPAGVVLLSVVGISAYAIAAITAETNMRTGTAAKSPIEAIKNSLSIVRTDRRLHDEITGRLLRTSPRDLDQVAGQLPETQ